MVKLDFSRATIELDTTEVVVVDDDDDDDDEQLFGSKKGTSCPTRGSSLPRGICQSSRHSSIKLPRRPGFAFIIGIDAAG